MMSSKLQLSFSETVIGHQFNQKIDKFVENVLNVSGPKKYDAIL